MKSTTVLYIGNFASVDPDEGTGGGENWGVVLGSYDQTNAAFVDIDLDDVDNNNIISSDDSVGFTVEHVTYDVGGGSVTTRIDAASQFDVTVTLQDGSSYADKFIVTQTQTGDAFIRVPDGLNIRSIELVSLRLNYLHGMDVGGTTSVLVCFAKDTLIATPGGSVRVQDLKVEDEVTTMDHGVARIEYVHAQRVVALGSCAPVRIAAGALGCNLPAQDLLVSRQHRIMCRSSIVQKMCGHCEVLIPAKDLVDLPGVAIEETGQPITYYHFMCTNHEIVLANGAAAETLFPGDETRKIINQWDDGRSGHSARLPLDSPFAPGRLARAELRGRRSQQLIHRHLKNGKHVWSEGRSEQLQNSGMLTQPVVPKLVALTP